MSSDNTSDDMNEIVESKIRALPSKSIEFFCVEYSFTVVPSDSYLVSHMSSLPLSNIWSLVLLLLLFV